MLSDEEKKAIDNMKSLLLYSKEHEYFSPFQEQEIDDMNIVLNLIEKQSKEIEELKKENLEIRDWKYVIDSPIDLDKLKELDLIKIKGKEYVSKDKLIELREIDNIDLIQCKLRKLLEE